ncbi:MAG: thiamine pyrophosphate-binding protein, partial [Alphaproteobacteria bacterium]|nr:thiamine pyrophosphate-binding protein [Alphaproteobacteria bacterium]
YGQLTGLPGICMSTLGPGSTNLVNGVANAFLDRPPMIALSGQMGTRLEPTFTHQNVDHVRLFASVSKWATRMVPAAAGGILRKAFRLATAERPGPVHITMPIDVGAAEAGDAECRLPPMALPQGWAEIVAVPGAAGPAEALRRARRPVLLVGMAAKRMKAGPAVKALAERLGAPVIVSPKAKGTLAEDHPYYAGTIDMACNGFLWDFLGKADLILAIGFDAVELIKSWRLATPVIHIDAVPNTDQVYPADLELVGSIPAILDALAAGCSGEAKWREAEIAAHRRELMRLYYEGRVPGRLNPTDVVDAVREAMPRQTLITMDVGSHKILVGQGWTAYEPNSVLLTNGLSAMGFALPGAMTAKYLERDRPVVCFTGDGGFAMVQSELQLAASLGLGLIVVVFCDNSLNRIEIKQLAKQYASTGTRFAASDLVKLAEAMGCHGLAVADQAALQNAVAGAGRLDRPLVIEARIDPAQYSSQF